jgi:hypothetical protein
MPDNTDMSGVIKEEAEKSLAQIRKLSETRDIFETVGKEIIAKIQLHVDRHITMLSAFDLGQFNAPVNKSVEGLRKSIAEEGYQLAKSAAVAAGAAQGIEIVLNIVSTLEQKAKIASEDEVRQKALEEKVESGTIDENTPRKTGTRPEGLKNIRKAKTSITKSVSSSKKNTKES